MAVRTVEESAERLLSFDELQAQLRAVGEERYHHKHPFQLLADVALFQRGGVFAGSDKPSIESSYSAR